MGWRWQSQPEVQAAAERLGGRQVHWLGYVTAERLLECYRRAAALVFPSLHEGFGLPVLEAMASGCPVACSGTTSTGEVAGDAALTFDPEDRGEVAERVHRVLTDTNLREELRRRGLERAATFSWQRTARESLMIYETIRL
jgi:glycosyltransferase involved in cell wall biosynthesis